MVTRLHSRYNRDGRDLRDKTVRIEEAVSVHTVRIDKNPLPLATAAQAFGAPVRVVLDDSIWPGVDASRRVIERVAAGDHTVYGINTGFGHLCTKRISSDKQLKLQENLVVSHAVGVGPPVPDALVRLMMLLKIKGLALGCSGVRRELIHCLTEFVNADLLPVVPSQGSLGASGDLAPLAHMTLPLIGRGFLRQNGREMDAATALAEANRSPLSLDLKEGLAMINGTQLMSAYACGLLARARHLLRHCDIVAAMSLEGLRGSIKPFDAALNQLRPHAGAVEAAANVRTLMADSRIVESHANCQKVQDPYSLRCVPQVHGASRQTIAQASEVVQTEINSVTDNPVVIDGDRVVSGGLFHGQPLALTLDALAVALAELANISERRTYLLLSGQDGLPVSLMQDTGINSGFMLPQYTAAALVSENKVLCSPASVDSIPTSLGQEDHVSMGATAATKAWRVMDNVETVLAIEQMCAAQALDYRAPIEPGIGVRIAHRLIRERITHTEEDRLFAEDIQVSLDLLRSRRIVEQVEAELGNLA